MSLVHNFTQRLDHNPLGVAALLYIAGVISALVYAYSEPRDER
ncbi:MAG: hypothetical protein OEU68_13480 [Nitrospira sp.]|nr:hypothetical protein [Nitrospira sp.]MDH4244244.1 hypothetical protein [Nitrospira sp.]MDH4357385.1 hypothetical protein [Nitrospira sp.]MDH5319310.1 hypothetical protein [Nitrospira sp.]